MHDKTEVTTFENAAAEASKVAPACNVEDGDLALNLLQSHFEPYTKEEEKKVLRKIDLRLALVMLFVNGIQFVDKLVRLL
jgi:hypothetical protein